MSATTHEPMITRDPTGEMGMKIREMLEERFRDLFVFNPIIVEVKTDHEGDEYLHTYIVFDGEFDNLDPEWTGELSVKLWPRATALGYPAIPIQSYVAKSEWEQLKRMLRMK